MIESSTEEGIARITLNRPEKLNAFSGSMRDDLRSAIERAGTDRDVRVIMLMGAGRAFCAGGDVAFMAALQRERNTAAFRALLDAGREVILAIRNLEKPVLAVIQGVAAGAGCNLALACDYRIAAEGATLGQTFVRIGLHPDWGGTWLLPRLVGPSRAFELMASGRMVAAEEALSIGMVDRVVPAAELRHEAEALARSWSAAAPLALAGIKRALTLSERNDLREQLELEAENQLRAFSSSDAAEGMAAFFEKRNARFRGE